MDSIFIWSYILVFVLFWQQNHAVLRGNCNTCNSNGATCTSETTWSVCSSPAVFSCSKEQVCTDSEYVCVSRFDFEPICNDDNCSSCKATNGVFACMDQITYALCNGNEPVGLFQCPEGMVCNVESPRICTSIFEATVFASILFWQPNQAIKLVGKCNECFEYGHACLDEIHYKLCDSDIIGTCPVGQVCIDNEFRCWNDSPGEAACYDSTSNCSSCEARGLFACIDDTTYTFCCNNNQPNMETLYQCPEGHVCDLENSQICSPSDLMKIFILIWQPNQAALRGNCNVCNANGVACVDEHQFQICISGIPTGSTLSCKGEAVCTDDMTICSANGKAPICFEDNCNSCEKTEGSFACVDEISYGFCYGGMEPDQNSIRQCPLNHVCNLVGSQKCIPEGSAVPSCPIPHVHVTTESTTEETTVTTTELTTTPDDTDSTTESTTEETTVTTTESSTMPDDSTSATESTTEETTTESSTMPDDSTSTTESTTEETTTESTTTPDDSTSTTESTTEETTTESSTMPDDSTSTTESTTEETTTESTTTPDISTSTTESTTEETTTESTTTPDDSTSTTESTTEETTTESTTTPDISTSTTESTTEETTTESTTTPDDSTSTTESTTEETTVTTTESTTTPDETDSTTESTTEETTVTTTESSTTPDDSASTTESTTEETTTTESTTTPSTTESTTEEITSTVTIEDTTTTIEDTTTTEDDTTSTTFSPSSPDEFCNHKLQEGYFLNKWDPTCKSYFYCYPLSGQYFGAQYYCAGYFNEVTNKCQTNKPINCI